MKLNTTFQQHLKYKISAKCSNISDLGIGYMWFDRKRIALTLDDGRQSSDL